MALSETYQLINEYGKNFNSIWNNTLKPEFLKHEDFRKRELASFRSTEYLLVALFILCLIGFLFSFNYGKLFVLILGIISGLLLWQIITLPQKADKKFTSQIKSQYLDIVMDAFAGIKRIMFKTPINEFFLDKSEFFTLLKKSELFADFSFTESDDAFAGVHKNVDYKIAEVKLSDYWSNRRYKNLTKLTVFQGVVISFPSNKTIKNRTLVSSRGDFKIKGLPLGVIIALIVSVSYRIYIGEPVIYWMVVGLICLIISFIIVPGSEVTKEITLEDPRFMKKYRAFSSDEVEGRYLLTTAFMERLNNVRTAFGTNNLKCSFVDERFVVAISTKEDLFEICSLFTPMDNPKHLSKFYNQIVAVLLMADYFKLDEKTGL